MAAQATFHVYIRDAAYHRVGELTDWHSLDLVLRFNDVGTWSLETSASSVEAALLAKTGGIIVTREIGGTESTIFSGFVWTEWGYTARTFRASGYSDDALLWQPARPSVGIPSPPWPDAYYVRTGTASTVMRNLVNENMGPSAVLPWQNLNIQFPTDPLLGSAITVRANLEPVLTVLAELAITPYAGGLGFYLRQSDTTPNKLDFVVYAPPDKSADAKFSVDLGTAQDYEDTQQAPEANHVYVMGGDGFGTNRTVIEAVDAASIAEWGRRISTVVDMRGTTDVGELNVRAAETIAGVSTLRRVAVTPFEVPSLQYGPDYDLGTLVTIVTSGGQTVDLIRQVEISLDPEKGAVVTPIVGQGDGSDDERMATITRTIQSRISNLERNWNVPDNSITNAMMYTTERWQAGDIRPTLRPSLAPGWLPCNGQAVSRSIYAALYAVIGTAFGVGDGSTTFNLPDFRDRFPVGAGLSFSLWTTGGGTASLAHDHTGAPHTHPGSHSHGMASHTHTGASHTHPGSHSHGIGSHTHTIGHTHQTPIDHDHGSVVSGHETSYDTDTFGRTAASTTGTGHHHNVDVDALTGNATSTSQSTSTSGSSSGTTDPDSNAPSASFSGSTGTASPASTDPDSNAPAASYSGNTGSSLGSTAIVPKFVAVNYEIYANG